MISFNKYIDNVTEATIEIDAMDPDNKDFLKFLKKHNVKIIDKQDAFNGLEITMQGKRKDLEAVLADDEYGWDDPDLAEYIEESATNESKIVLKRKYTENHPAVTAGKNARIRNKMLEAIADGKISQEEFNNILKEFSKDTSKWTRRNSKFFNVSEEGISLSKFGKKALAQITVNEETNKTENKMKNNFIFESFSEFVNTLNEESTESLNEAFASQKLASLLTGGEHMDKDLPKAFYQMSKLQLDKIQDVDIIEMDPLAAKKEKRANAVYFYFTTNAKENPYAGKSAWREEKQIPANTLLAITNGSNEWMATEWQRTYSRSQKSTKTLKVGKREDAAGFKKSGRGEYNSGISSMKQVSELADRAYVLDLDILKARYSSAEQRDERAAAKKGATAFKNDKDFKAENLARYNNIIANRAAEMPIDKMVQDSIDIMANQIKDAITKGEKGRYGDIIVGKTDKGREAKLSDASNHMRGILDDFNRYVGYTNDAEKEKESGYSGDYYQREVKNYAKRITDKIKQIETFSYAW